jgi:hypothetical protein
MLELGHLDHRLCHRNKLFRGRFIPAPFDSAMPPTPVEQTVDCGHRVVKWEAAEICPGRKNLGVTSTHVLKSTRHWIHNREMRNGAKKTHGGRGRELLQPLDNLHMVTVTVDFDTTNKNVEAICGERGVEVSECFYGGKVLQG